MKNLRIWYQILNKYKFNNGIIANNHYIQYRNIQTCITSQEKEQASSKSQNQICYASTKASKIPVGPSLQDFLESDTIPDSFELENIEPIPYIPQKTNFGLQRKVYFDIYGCQMNVNDTEIIWSILKSNNFLKTGDLNEADVVLVITCAIREGAESKIWNRLEYLKGIRNKKIKRGQNRMKIGILGCMAERLKQKLLDKDQAIDLVAGPDAYKDLPRLLAITDNNQKAVNVLLSLDETYADITPVRLNQNSKSAFVSIMRGCDNMCTYCIVPFTRGRERSRPVDSIVREVEHLVEEGVREVTLLGQNVNSYRDTSQQNEMTNITSLAKGFKTVYKQKIGGLRFADLLERVSRVDPELRVRFTSPHPKDFPDEVLYLIRDRPNICKSIHLPAQSGNSVVLERMRRGYSRETYLELVEHIRNIIPSIALSSDFICGFCGETEEQFQDTLSLMKIVGYSTAYLFPYSMREKTTAHRRFADDVPNDTKKRRLEEMITLFRNQVEVANKAQIGKKQLILVEGVSKRSSQNLFGRNDSNIKVIFPKTELPTFGDLISQQFIKPGDYIVVKINAATSQVLKGIPLYHTTLSEYHVNNAQ